MVVRSLVEFNMALQGKRLWRFMRERESMWRKVIGAKFVVKKLRWYAKILKGLYGAGLWKRISMCKENCIKYI